MLVVAKLKLHQFAKQAVAGIKANAINMDTGQYLPLSRRKELADQVTYELTDDELIIRGGGYFYTLVFGRGPTVNPGPGAVRRYVSEYLKEQGESGEDLQRHAFFASRKIHEYGSKPFRDRQPTTVVSQVINTETIRTLTESISTAFAADASRYILNSVR